MAEENVESRKEMAKNSTSPDELEKLAEDEKEEVKCGVISNSNTPISLLENFLKDKDKDTQGYAKVYIKSRK